MKARSPLAGSAEAELFDASSIIANASHWAHLLRISPNENEKGHLVQFYQSDSFLAEAVSLFIGTGLHAGEGAVIVATAEHRLAFENALSSQGVDVRKMMNEGQLHMLDAAETLSTFVVNGSPDPKKFEGKIGGLIDEISARFKKVRAYGEMVGLLWDEGNKKGTVELEHLWNTLSETRNFSLLCGYAMDKFKKGEHQKGFQDICHSHTHVLPAENYLQLEDRGNQLRAIALLQQQALSLRAEIEERKKIEIERGKIELERQDLLRRTKRQLEELTKSNTDLKRFAYVASHDLSEPLRTITSYGQLLELKYRDILDQNGKDYLGFIVDAGKRMYDLIQDLLTYSRLNAQEEPFKTINGNAIFDAAVANLQAVVQSTGARVEKEDLPSIVGNPTQILQLLQNLISNGIKFQPTDQIPEIAVSALEKGGYWEFCVSDNGIGISVEHQESLFEMFKRVHSQEKYPGTGMGLAICKQIVEGHGGSIKLESAENRGTRVFFTIPKR